MGRVRGGWLVFRPNDPEDNGIPGGEGDWDYGVLDREGNWVRTLQTNLTGYGPKIDASKRRVFFMDREHRPLIVDVTTGKVTARHMSPSGDVQGFFWAGKRVVLETFDDDGVGRRTYLWDPSTNTIGKALDLSVLNAASQSGRLLVEDGDCVRVTEPSGRPVTLQGGGKLPTICGQDASAATISPDGKFLAAGSTLIEVDTGRQALKGTTGELVWEDSNHVLFVVRQNEVRRCALEEGRCEVALRGRSGPPAQEISLLTG